MFEMKTRKSNIETETYKKSITEAEISNRKKIQRNKKVKSK